LTICSATPPAEAHAVTIQIVEGGFPHSEILGSKLVRSSPGLIAAYHVLHRLSAPRHPPNALISLHHSHDRCPRPAASAAETASSSERPLGPDLSVRTTCRTYPSSDAVKRRPCSPGAKPGYRICSLFTMYKIAARHAARCETLTWTLAIGGSRRNGGARRDRTDDLMLAKHALSQLSYGPEEERTSNSMVGLGRLERPTSPLSGVRSNHLSYRPEYHAPKGTRPGPRRPKDHAMSREERETKTAVSRI
jgi:hypothetical protein